jgi:hypothetical protein
MKPFDYLNAINTNKKDLMAGTENDELAEKSYVPYITNKSLSYFPDTLLAANEMNQYHFLENKLQFHYLLNICRPSKRFAKWVKQGDSDDLQLVMEYYSYNVDKAKQVLPLLSKEQLSIIKTKLQHGVEDDNLRESG